ncbi:MAG: TonB-dependent receptor [bacterium]|nr:TonB-dependent receptor [bacterium]
MIRKNIKQYIIGIIFIFCFFAMAGTGYSQENITVSGKVYDSITKKPVTFGSVVVLELRLKVRTEPDGSYSLAVPKPGTYTVYVSSMGLKTHKTKLTIAGPMTKDFTLYPARITGGLITIRGEKKKQKVSRQTLSVKQLKEVPATFGDSLGALATLPGITRSGGIFGPLIIRGVPMWENQYFIDDVPIQNPMHFGGLHSVISNDLMEEIDVYSSSFPAKFGNALGGVIRINTVDDVKELSGHADIGLISANAIVKAPIKGTGLDGKEENKGYAIVAGRIGYLSVFVPLFYKLIMGEDLKYIPDYWDYQFKSKYYINSRHSLTLMLFGSKDAWEFLLEEGFLDEGSDPLVANLEFTMDEFFNSQALYYTYEPSPKFSNKLMFFTSLNSSNNRLSFTSEGAADWAKNRYINSKPYIFTFKDKLRWEWIKDTAELETAVSASYYYFIYDSKWFDFTTNSFTGNIDVSDPDAAVATTDYDTFSNQTLSAYLENRFTFWWITLVPGVRTEYLHLTKRVTVSPRGMASIELPSKTTFSVAGGYYNYFFQVNPAQFVNNPKYASIGIVEGEELVPEKAIHAVAGIEQVYDLWTLKIEVFRNQLFNMAVLDPHYINGVYIPGSTTGEYKTFGVEVILRLDSEDDSDGLYGWLSYTYLQSDFKSGIPSTRVDSNGAPVDPNGSNYIPFDFEQTHAVKAVAGFRFFGSHTIGARFEYYSSFPYTPITGASETPSGSGRYTPTYSSDVNSARLRPQHRLDLRYSHKTNYEWGYITWYVEIVNIYNSRAEELDWHYGKPYQPGVNPTVKTQDQGLSFIPNFGIEVKF